MSRKSLPSDLADARAVAAFSVRTLEQRASRDGESASSPLFLLAPFLPSVSFREVWVSFSSFLTTVQSLPFSLYNFLPLPSAELLCAFRTGRFRRRRSSRVAFPPLPRAPSGAATAGRAAPPRAGSRRTPSSCRLRPRPPPKLPRRPRALRLPHPPRRSLLPFAACLRCRPWSSACSGSPRLVWSRPSPSSRPPKYLESE